MPAFNYSANGYTGKVFGKADPPAIPDGASLRCRLFS